MTNKVLIDQLSMNTILCNCKLVLLSMKLYYGRKEQKHKSIVCSFVGNEVKSLMITVAFARFSSLYTLIFISRFYFKRLNLTLKNTLMKSIVMFIYSLFVLYLSNKTINKHTFQST